MKDAWLVLQDFQNLSGLYILMQTHIEPPRGPKISGNDEGGQTSSESKEILLFTYGEKINI